MKKLYFWFFLLVGAIISLLVVTGVIAQTAIIPELNSQDVWGLVKIFGYGFGALFCFVVMVVLIKVIEQRESADEEDN